MAEEKKMTYEELTQAANGLASKAQTLETYNNQLIQKVKELSEFAAFKRLDYLFKVVELANNFSPEFVVKCVEEIESTMTIPEPIETEDNNGE